MTDQSSSPHALIIEDGKIDAKIITHALQAANYLVTHIIRGEQAMQWLKKNTPCLIVLDLHLPVVSGMEILAYIKRTSRFNHVPVIIISADPYAARALNDIADLVLVKPISYSQVTTLAKRFQ